jgi:WbqC-like protein
MRVAIVQSCYVPWKGYFDLIRSADHFILLDDVQYSRGDWRNRNRIKTAQGLKWISIPLHHSGTFPALIHDMRVNDPNWMRSHHSLIEQAYRAAPGWTVLRAWLAEELLQAHEPMLSDVNERLTRSLCRMLGIATPITRSEAYGVQCEDPTERVVRLCQAVGATRYLSGPSARDYIDEQRFREAGIALEYFDYSGYPEYPQPHGPFEHAVSILDVIACLGTEAASALRREARAPA